VFWVISVYFNIRNTIPKSGTFLLGHPVYYPTCFSLAYHIIRNIHAETNAHKHRCTPSQTMLNRPAKTLQQDNSPCGALGLLIFDVSTSHSHSYTLGDSSARSIRPSHLTTHNTHNIQTSMPPSGMRTRSPR